MLSFHWPAASKKVAVAFHYNGDLSGEVHIDAGEQPTVLVPFAALRAFVESRQNRTTQIPAMVQAEPGEIVQDREGERWELRAHADERGLLWHCLTRDREPLDSADLAAQSGPLTLTSAED
jgi:hypothetical protein